MASTPLNQQQTQPICVIQPVLRSFNSHSIESIFLHMFIFQNSVLCSTLKGFIDINSCKNSMIYTSSTHQTSSTTPNDYTVPRLLCKAEFPEHVTSFPATMTQYFPNSDFGAISETKQSCPAPLSKVESQIIGQVFILIPEFAFRIDYAHTKSYLEKYEYSLSLRLRLVLPVHGQSILSLMISPSVQLFP